MQTVGITLFHILIIMIVLFSFALLMGKRQMSELSPLELILAIISGTIAGTGIIDSDIDLGTVIIVLVLIGFIQCGIAFITHKKSRLRHKIGLEPIVLIENGAIKKANLNKAQISLEMLLSRLREKDAFDINEVELAIFEPHGKISVLKKAEYQALKPYHVNVPVMANKILTPVVIEGKVQAGNLRQMGFSNGQIGELSDRYKDMLDNVTVAFMDQNRQLYIIRDDTHEKSGFQPPDS